MTWNVHEAILYYQKQGAPGDQSALISLLREIQRENGGSIPAYALDAIAGAYGVKLPFLHAIIKRIPSLRVADTHCLSLCAGPNCGKHTALAACAEALQKQMPGRLTVKFVPCMRMCGKGPNLRWDGKLYHRANEELLRALAQGKDPTEG